MTARMPLRLGLLVIVAFVVGVVVARYVVGPRAVPLPEMEKATLLPGPRVLPPLELVDHEGRAFTGDTLRGRWTLAFFGFTHCPDVCPTTLSVLAQVRRQLADLPEAQRPGVMLISVDPERDTPERLRQYVQFFDPEFVGATGTPEAIDAVTSAFAVPYAKVPLPTGGYTMDHGAGVFVVAPTGNVVAYVSPPLRAEEFARDFRRTVAWHEQVRR
jgi:protein SCO1